VRISLFVGCYNDTLFPETGIAVVNVLERLGHTVDYPLAQTCCGQMHYNTGYQAETVPLLRKFIEIFRDAEAICIPSSSCAAMVRTHYSKLAEAIDDQELEAEVEAIVPRVYEFTELLLNKLGVENVDAYYPHRVTYHASCHSLRSLCVGDGPVRLLRKVRDLEFVELPNVEQCCGFGGTFSVKNADTSAAMLSDKIKDVLATGAEVCTAIDNSCLMHLFGSLHRQRTGIKTAHIAEILATTENAKLKRAAR
jgi:L-lactate dehydrogenase complex protein LldE